MDMIQKLNPGTAPQQPPYTVGPPSPVVGLVAGGSHNPGHPGGGGRVARAVRLDLRPRVGGASESASCCSHLTKSAGLARVPCSAASFLLTPVAVVASYSSCLASIGSDQLGLRTCLAFSFRPVEEELKQICGGSFELLA